MENNNEKQSTIVDIESKVVGKIDLPKIDVSKYIGTKVPIELVETRKGSHGYFLKVLTKEFGVIDRGENNDPIVLKASALFGLFELDDGSIGWGDETKLGRYLSKMGVNHYKELVGKEVIVQTKPDKNNIERLTFN